MAKLTAYQQGLWDRYQKAVEEEETARVNIEGWKRAASQANRDRDLYETALEREGLSVEKLAASTSTDSAEVVANSDENGHQPAEVNKTHALIDIFQRFGKSGLGPTEAWGLTSKAYPNAEISRTYVNTLIGKLKAREILEKDEETGKYVLTLAGKKFQVLVADSGDLFENHNGEK